jgi:hypothetical protein
MFDMNKTIEFNLFSLKEKINIAEREVDRWKSLLNPGATFDSSNVIFVRFEQANEKLHKAEAEFDAFVSQIDVMKKKIELDDSHDNSDQMMVTPHERKRARTETPMSSIDILMDNEEDIDSQASQMIQLE